MDRVGEATTDNLDKYLLEFLCCLLDVIDVHFVLAAFVLGRLRLVSCFASSAASCS